MGKYYSIKEDMERYPECWVYLSIGGRGCGKTYSALSMVLDEDKPFLFVKRTIEDVTMLCAGGGKIGTKVDEFGVDLSPFKPINRDRGTDIRAFSIIKGLGGFWRCIEDDDGNSHPVGNPIGYVAALNACSKIKGYDLSECDYVIFDEFVPQPWERINKREGEQLLDLYKTVARDREYRGRPPLKLICLANAVKISNPTFNIFELTDTAAYMSAKHEEYHVDLERGIMLHMIPDNTDYAKKEKETILYKAMGGTDWGKMAFENNFAYDDMTQVSRTALKRYTPIVAYMYKQTTYYVYLKGSSYYICKSPFKKAKVYNLNRESEQRLFWIDYGFNLRLAAIEDRVRFESYTAYDILFNFKAYFGVS